MNQPIARLFVVVLVLFACSSASPRAGACSRRARCARTRRTSAPASRTSTSRAARSSPRDGDGDRPLGAPARRALHALLPVRGAVRLADRLLRPLQRRDASSSASATASLAGAPAQQSSILDQLSGRPTTGDEVVTTLDEHAQQVAYQALAGRDGAVVAIVPSTGAIRVMAASPSFDPNQVADHAAFERLNHDPAAPLVNRATAAQYAPGSTFKVVTAIAAIDTGRYTPASVVNGNSPIVVSGQPLSQRQRDELRAGLAQRRADQLDQYGVGAGRAEGRRVDPPGLHGPPRLLPHAADRPAGRRARGERRALPRPSGLPAARRRAPTSAASASARAGSR